MQNCYFDLISLLNFVLVKLVKINYINNILMIDDKDLHTAYYYISLDQMN